MTQEMNRSKARMIYENLKKNVAGYSTAEAEEEFKVSRGWFKKFKRRSGIHSVIKHGEGASANKGGLRILLENFRSGPSFMDTSQNKCLIVTKLGCSGSKYPKELSSQKKRSVGQGTNL